MESEANEFTNGELAISPPKVIQGKDEMNLAEFPLSAIADWLEPDQKTIVFEDRIWDESRGEMVARKLTITASDEFGLPTALDDEVILGLVQLSKLIDFREPEVSFSRYQLIQLLGWRNESKSYARLEQSLNRWVGVTLYYKNAWWNNADKCWMNENFHILESVTLFDQENARCRGRIGKQSPLPLSKFTWNGVLFRSFKAGNLKSIDFEFLKTLESAVAKRLYRFLDKRFFHRKRWEFNLHEVAWEHIGISRNYDTANLKRKLLPAIRELEQRGFLQPMSDTERFLKVRSGEWRVIFQRALAARTARAKISTEQSNPLVQALTERGVTPSMAQQTVASHPADRIQTQLEVFDWLVGNSDPKVSRNPAGFLISSIKSEYVPPKHFVSREEQAQRVARAEERKIQDEERARKRAAQEEVQRQARENAIQGFLQSLSDDERARIEAEALGHANNFEHDLLRRDSLLATAARKSLIDAFVLQLIQRGA